MKLARDSVEQYLTQWLDRTRSRVRASTLYDYARVVRLHVAAHIGRLRLARLSPLDIQTIYADLERAGVQPRIRLKVLIWSCVAPLPTPSGSMPFSAIQPIAWSRLRSG